MLAKFKENVKLRSPELYSRLDYPVLHTLTTERVQLATLGMLLKDDVTIDILTNNVLIITYTNLILHEARANESFNMTQALLLNMYKHVSMISKRGILDEDASDASD